MAHLTSDNILLSEPTRWHIWHDPRLYRLNPNAVSLLESALTHKRFRFRPDIVAKVDGKRLVRNNRIQDARRRTDEVVEIVRALVRHPEVQPWIFGTQEQSLRKILAEGKAGCSPITVASVKEIISSQEPSDIFSAMPHPT